IAHECSPRSSLHAAVRTKTRINAASTSLALALRLAVADDRMRPFARCARSAVLLLRAITNRRRSLAAATANWLALISWPPPFSLYRRDRCRRIRWRSSRPSPLLTLPRCGRFALSRDRLAPSKTPPQPPYPHAHRRGCHHLMDAPSSSSPP
ncbi:hypothetical protein Dimus_020994, partial [Dionaea muscipula]